MGKTTKVNAARFSIAISRDLSISLVEHQPGPPALCDGLIVTIADMTRTPPHGGELHPDGDELIYIVSGKVSVLEPTRLIGITPGPGGSHRPVDSDHRP